MNLGFGKFNSSNSGGNVESPLYFFCFRSFFIFELINSSYRKKNKILKMIKYLATEYKFNYKHIRYYITEQIKLQINIIITFILYIKPY